MKKDTDDVLDIIDCIESNICGFKILDGDDNSIILRSDKTGCDFEIVIKEFESEEN
ncbi:hypothetical protein NSB24_28320 [Blautia coccoides]|uniref:Uncharacterized protein n=1 Tax=Blautia producta TaxID=33035 RepID=A0ABZ0U560_9FIRM|nr:hypothetical protein [Blautia coccoides]MCR1990084.1 hypothetical protein [Blautia coccoides]TCO46585.1 hypothetical protein EV205_16111 [Blautia coccoides]WPX72352.1 hypothetical protein BLCOC_06880 [Blautia coccoides]SUY05784.1 Uncharacterised protein [Blautia coccoides]